VSDGHYFPGCPDEKYFEKNAAKLARTTGVHVAVETPAQTATRPAKFVSARIEKPRAENLSAPTQGSKEPLPFLSLGALLEAAPEKPRWVWDGYVAEGAFTLLGGRPKVGKSTLTFGLLRALETGEQLLGRKVTPTRTLLLSEERRDSLAEKARRFGIGDDNVEVLLRHDAHGRTWPEIAAEAFARCREMQIGLLVVDTFSKWVQFRGDEENSTGAVLAALEPLQPFVAAGIAVLLVVHQRKSSGSHGDAVKGNNALPGEMEFVVELERAQGFVTDDRVLRAVSRFESTPDEVFVSLDGDHYTVSDRQAAKADAERAQLLEALEAAGGEATRKELADETGIPGATVQKRLAGLAGVEQVGGGKRGDPIGFVSARALPKRAETLFEGGES